MTRFLLICNTHDTLLQSFHDGYLESNVGQELDKLMIRLFRVTTATVDLTDILLG